MKLSQMYQQQLEELRKQGLQEGREEGQQEGLRTGVERERRAIIESILQVRFGEVDAELTRIINPLMAMSREEFTPLLLQSSRGELLARFSAQ